MNTRLTTILITASAGAAALGAAGCGTNNSSASDSPGAPKTPAKTTPAAATTTPVAKKAATDGKVTVTLSEWAVTPSAASAPAGEVTFDVTNNGKSPHEMVVLKTTKQAGALGTGARVPETGHVGETEDMAPGAHKVLKLKLKPGHYALICNMPGHYASGMHTDFTVS